MGLTFFVRRRIFTHARAKAIVKPCHIRTMAETKRNTKRLFSFVYIVALNSE